MLGTQKDSESNLLLGLESVISTAELSRRPSRPPDHAAENRALVALARQLSTSPTGILQTLVETALQLCRAHTAGISLFEKDRKNFYWPAVTGRWECHVGGGAPRDFAPCGTVLDRNAAQLFSHPERHFTTLSSVTPAIDEGLVLPFHADGQAVGTIWVIAHDQNCRFDEEDRRVMTNLASFAGAAYQILPSVRAATGAHRDLLQTASAVEAERAPARENEEGSTPTAHVGRIGHWQLDLATGTLESSETCKANFGLRTDDELTYQRLFELIHPDDRDHVATRVRDAILSHGAYEAEYRNVWPDGSTHWINARGSASYAPDGTPQKMVGTTLDITAGKQAKEALRRSEERLRGVFNTSAMGVAVLTPDARFLQVNAAFCSITGYSEDELRALDCATLTHPDDCAAMQVQIDQLLSGDIPNFVIEKRCLKKDGRTTWVKNSVSLTRDALARPEYLVTLCEDVTARKQAESLLFEQSNLLELIASGCALDECLSALCEAVPRLDPHARACVLLADGERRTFSVAVTPPDLLPFGEGMRGAPINELAIGTCGTAVYEGKPFACTDVANGDPWSKMWRDLCVAHGVLACHSTPIPHADGKPLGSLMLCFAETRAPREWERAIGEFGAHIASIAIERDRSVSALRESKAQLAAELAAMQRLQETSILLIQEDDIDALYRQILNAAAAVMRAEFASMQMLYPERRKLRLLASTGFNPAAAASWEWVRPGPGSTCGIALRTGERSFVPDIETCAFMAGTEDLETYHQAGIRAVQSTPLISRSGRMLGTISTHWRDPHQPVERDLRLLDVLARQAADLIERKQTEEALRESEGRFRTIADTAPALLWVTEPDASCSFLSRGWSEFTGQTESEGLGFGWLDAVHPDDRAGARDAFLAANARHEAFVLDYRVRRADGAYRWAIATARPRFGPGGKFLGHIGSVVDIDQRKRLEQSLAAEKEMLELISSGAPLHDVLDTLARNTEAQSTEGMLCSVLLMDETGHHLRHGAAPSLPAPYNQAIDGVRIGPRVGSCGTAAYERRPVFVADIARDPLWADFKELAATHGLGACCSRPIMSSQGQLLGTIAIYYRHARHASAHDRSLIEQATRLAGIVIERKQAEKALCASEERFRSVFEQTTGGIAQVDLTGRFVLINDRFCEIVGRSREELMKLRMQDVTHPEDLRGNVQQFMSLANGDGPNYVIEKRYVCPDTSLVWVRNHVAGIRNAEGKVSYITAAVTDITERKRAEETQQLLVRELNHRVKNTLATIEAIARQTLRRATSPERFVASFSGRIHALSRVHTLLTKATWQGADLRELIRDQVLLGPIDDTRLTAWGPSVSLEPQLALHMAIVLHEFATNSCKYGALSVADGWVAVSWTVHNRELRLRWLEHDGPLVRSPAARGFGMTVIEQSVKAHQGNAQMLCEPQGVMWFIELPLPTVAPDADNEPLSAAAALMSASAEKGRTRGRLAGKRVLVVEDEPPVALDLVGTLREAGTKAVGVSTAKAVRLIEVESFDAALVNVKLTGRPVDEIAAALTRRDVPFAFVTASDRDSLPLAFRGAAMLAKPCTREAVVDAAEELVVRRQRRSA